MKYHRLIVIALLLASTVTLMGVTAAASAGQAQYIVHPGDTLFRIATTHSVTVRQLAAANGIRNVNRIHVGQVLRIPVAEPPIILEQPASGAQVTSPVTVSGQGNTFEGQVAIRVLDSRFRQVGLGHATAAMGQYAPFTADIQFAVPYSQWGYIDAFWNSAKDGTELDKVTVRVYLQKGGTPPVPTPTPGPQTSINYHVHPGDTLYQIAQGHGVTARSIVRENGLRNPNLIRIGQKLIISSAHPGIILETPANDTAVGNPVDVAGQSDTFEGNVALQVLDHNFRRVGTGNAQGGTTGAYAPFAASLSYSVRADQWGYVEAYWPDAATGARRDAVTTRVRLSRADAIAASAPVTAAASAPVTVTAPVTTTTPAATTAAAPITTTAPVTATAAAASESIPTRYHIIRRGENLYGIAARYGVTVRAIAQANHLRNINRIYWGQRLIIP